MISLRKMNSVRVDPRARKAWAGPGTTLGQFDQTHAFGLATPVGRDQLHYGNRRSDPLLLEGQRNYWKSHDFLELSDDLLDAVLPFVAELPSESCEVFFAQMGGATNRVPPEATAYRHWDANFILNVHGRWENAGDDDRCIAWTRDLFEATTPFTTGGVYVNFMTEEEGARVQSAYGDGYARLAQLKAKYDPTNFFRMNQNIRPAT